MHGNERPIEVTLPVIEGISSYTSLWSSVPERPDDEHPQFAPGSVIALPGTALHLFRMEPVTSPARSIASDPVFPNDPVFPPEGARR